MANNNNRRKHNSNNRRRSNNRRNTNSNNSNNTKSNSNNKSNNNNNNSKQPANTKNMSSQPQPRDYGKDINFADSEKASDNVKKANQSNEQTLAMKNSKVEEKKNENTQESLVNVDENDDVNGSKALGIIAIVLGILIIAAGFTVFRFFNTQGTIETTDTTPVEIVEVQEKKKDEVEMTFEGVTLNDSDKPAEWEELDGVIAHVPFINRFKSNSNKTENPQNQNNSMDRENTNVSDEKEDVDVVIIDGINEIAERNDNNKIFKTNNEEERDNVVGYSNNPEPATSTTWTANNYDQGDIESGSHTVVSGDTLWELAEGAYGDGAQWTRIADANNVGYLSNGNPLIVPGQVLTIP